MTDDGNTFISGPDIVTPSDTPTPRTDAAETYRDGTWACVDASFARQLERELADANNAMAIPWRHRDDPVDGVDGCACIACELHRVYRRELAAEREAHDRIASICFAAGANTGDGTSVSAVKDLAAKLGAEREAREKAEAAALQVGDQWRTQLQRAEQAEANERKLNIARSTLRRCLKEILPSDTVIMIHEVLKEIQ